MKYLFINTCIQNCTIAIIENNKILYSFNECIKEDMSSKILPIIDNGFKSVSFDLKDIDKIFIVNGPGSFTGIRIGVSIAKTIAWGFKIPIIPLSSLEVMATTTTDSDYVIPMIDARRGNVFSGVYDNELNIIIQDSLINKEKLLKLIKVNYSIVSYDYDNCKIPCINILAIINKHLNDKVINPHELNPRYLKLTEAEENKLNNV